MVKSKVVTIIRTA